MNKLLLTLLLSTLAVFGYAQDTLRTSLAILYTVTVPPTPGGPGGSKGFIVTGFGNDTRGLYDVFDVIVGDIVWDSEGHRFEVLEINSRSGNTISLDVEALTEGTPVYETGVGCIMAEVGTLPTAFIIGLSDMTKMAIDNHRANTSRYDEIQSIYAIGTKIYLSGTIVPVDLDSVVDVNTCKFDVIQTAHGFVVGDLVYWDGVDYEDFVGVYGDTISLDGIVTAAPTDSTFTYAFCGQQSTDFGLPDGSYFATDTGLELSPDTSEWLLLKVFGSNSIVNPIKPYSKDVGTVPLFNITTSEGVNNIIGGESFDLDADSVAIIDTICGVPVTNLAEAIAAAKLCIPNAPGVSTNIAYWGSDGKLKNDTAFVYTEGTNQINLNNPSLGTTISTTDGLLLRNSTLATVLLGQRTPMIQLLGNEWETNGTAASSPFGVRMYALGYVGTGQLSSTPEFFITGTSSNGSYTPLLRIRQGFSTTNDIVQLGVRISGTPSSGIGILDESTWSGSNSVLLGTQLNVTGNTNIVVGRNNTSSTTNSLLFGHNLSAVTDKSGLIGRGAFFSPVASNSLGVGIVHEGLIPQIRTIGFNSTLSANAWTASSTTITLTTPVSTFVVGQGVVLCGTTTANISYRTITAVNSTTEIVVSSAPVVTSGTHISTQTDDVFQIGNGATSYNQHLVVNRSGYVGLNVTDPTARLHLSASAARVGGASLKINEGTRQTTGEDGTINHVSDNLEFTVGATPYVLAKTLTNTATLDYGSIASLATETLTITVTGAAIGDVVMVGIDNASKSAGLIFGTPWVSATNTVSLEAYNSTLSPIDPASGTFRASVIKY